MRTRTWHWIVFMNRSTCTLTSLSLVEISRLPSNLMKVLFRIWQSLGGRKNKPYFLVSSIDLENLCWHLQTSVFLAFPWQVRALKMHNRGMCYLRDTPQETLQTKTASQLTLKVTCQNVRQDCILTTRKTYQCSAQYKMFEQGFFAWRLNKGN